MPCARAASARIAWPTPMHARLAATRRMTMQPFDDQGLAIAQAFAQHAVERCAAMPLRVNGKRGSARATGKHTLADFSAFSFVFLLQRSNICATRFCTRHDAVQCRVLRIFTAPCDINAPRSDTAALFSPGTHREERNTCDGIDAGIRHPYALQALMRAPGRPYLSAARWADSSAAGENQHS